MMIPVDFTSSDSALKGYFFPAVKESAIATVIFLQGFPGVEGDELICGRLAQAGVNVLTFNYRGTFQSGSTFTFPHAIADISAARHFLQEAAIFQAYQVDPEEIVLGGWSFGGAMVPAGAVQNPGIKRMFMISGRNFGKEARKIESDPDYAAQVAKNLEALCAPHGPLKYHAGMIPELVQNQDTFDYEKLAPRLKDRDIFLIAGWDDTLTPIEEHTLPFYRSLVHSGAQNVRIEAVRDDHEFSNSKDQLVQMLLEWLMAA